MKRADAIESGRIVRRRDPAVAALAKALLAAVEAGEIPAPLPHYPFYRAHGWYFDFAWPREMLAADVGNFDLLAPREKLEFASEAGWRVFRFSPKEVRDGTAIDCLSRALAHPPLFKP
jgi:hypothetical protein